MFTAINNLEQLFNFLDDADIECPEEIMELLADNNVVVSPDVAALILEAA